MANVFNVAKYILQQQGEISTMKLQKLVYYSQAWSLAWDDTPIFNEEIQAWINGPVVPALYNIHKGQLYMAAEAIDIYLLGNELTTQEEETIDTVLASYGNKSPQWLSDQTHIEAPWLKAREGLSDMERGTSVISLSSMLNYYSSL